MIDGFHMYPAALRYQDQKYLVDWAHTVARQAPWYTPTMYRTGKPMSVRMTCAGDFGWFSDQAHGYRYVRRHPQDHVWPPIHPLLHTLWHTYGKYAPAPECCLVNWYTAQSKMGLHIDQDEEDPNAPVVSISLGDEAVFRVCTPDTKRTAARVILRSGDIVILSHKMRFAYHGIDRIRFGSSRLVPEGGRFNLTLRRVTRPLPGTDSSDQIA